MFFVTIQQVNDRVDEVNSTIDSNFNRIRTDVQQQVQALQQSGADTLPAPTVSPIPTTTPAPTVTADPTESATPESTPDAGATATPTPEEPEIINP